MIWKWRTRSYGGNLTAKGPSSRRFLCKNNVRKQKFLFKLLLTLIILIAGECEKLQSDNDLLTKELNDLLKAQFGLRMQVAMQQLSNTSQLKKVRRDIARVKTVMNSKEAS